jgi:hypothetical protein
MFPNSVKSQLKDGYRRIRTVWDWRTFAIINPLLATECGLVAQWGIGDHYLVCALALAVERATGLHVVVAGNPRYAFLADLFHGVTRYVPLPLRLINRECGLHEIRAGAFSYAHFRGWELFRACGYRDFQLIDAYKCLLRLDWNEVPEAPIQPAPSELIRAREFLERERLPSGRTAILCPEAISIAVGPIDDMFWRRLAAELRACGLVPVINTGPRARLIEGIRAVQIELPDFRAVAECAGYFFAVRSGICDLVSNLATCQKIVFYPDTALAYGSVFSGANFTGYHLANAPLEVIVSQGSTFSWNAAAL